MLIVIALHAISISPRFYLNIGQKPAPDKYFQESLGFRSALFLPRIADWVKSAFRESL
jgi:hypothetical protein